MRSKRSAVPGRRPFSKGSAVAASAVLLAAAGLTACGSSSPTAVTGTGGNALAKASGSSTTSTKQAVPATTARPATGPPVPGADAGIAAQWSSPATGQHSVLEVFSAATGTAERQVAKLPAWPSTLDGPFAGPGGSFWFSEAVPARSKCSRCMESAAVPNSCRSDVVEIPASGPSDAATTVLRAPASEAVQDAVPNVAGPEVAYQAEACTGFMSWHYVVRNLATGKQVEIGAGNALCHASSEPSWSPDGRELIFTWGPSSLAVGASQPGGGAAGPSCPQWHNSEVAVVPAGHSGLVTSSELHGAGKGCSYVAAVFDKLGISAVEDCGARGGWLGQASLVQLNSSFRPVLRLALPPRPDGATLSANKSGADVLVDEYSAPAQGSPGNIPTDWLLVFNGKTLRTLVRDHTGVDSLTYATWS